MKDKIQLIDPAKWVSFEILLSLFVCLSRHDIWNVKVSSKQGSLSKWFIICNWLGPESCTIAIECYGIRTLCKWFKLQRFLWFGYPILPPLLQCVGKITNIPQENLLLRSLWHKVWICVKQHKESDLTGKILKQNVTVSHASRLPPRC